MSISTSSKLPVIFVYQVEAIAKFSLVLAVKLFNYGGAPTKILSQWGIASRRGAEAMILAGRVRCNGTVVGLGQVDPLRDRIEVDGKLVQPVHRPTLVYLLLNKPSGVVSTCYAPKDVPPFGSTVARNASWEEFTRWSLGCGLYRCIAAYK